MYEACRMSFNAVHIAAFMLQVTKATTVTSGYFGGSKGEKGYKNYKVGANDSQGINSAWLCICI